MLKSRPMTPDLVKMIKESLSTGLYSQMQIASIAGVNQGRVSEVKHGRWDHLLGSV